MKGVLNNVNNGNCENNSTISEYFKSQYLQCAETLSVNRPKRHKMENNLEKLEIPSLVPSTSKTNLPENSTPVPSLSEQLSCDEKVATSKNQNTATKRVRNKTDNCLFCKNNVTNFTRHIVRKHKNETEVTKFLALPKGSAERKLQADLLRKRGNFLYHVEKENKIRTVRSPNKKSKKSTTDSDYYLPCKYCLGMFKRKFLHRHLKICKNNKNKTEDGYRAQADGQNLMLDLSDIDKELVEKVFSRMACDNISFVAKSDKLITSFGTKCLKLYRDKRLTTSVPQKMRTLARFLIAMRNEVSTIHSLQDCLRPNYFDAIVKCAKKSGRSNEKMDSCKPTLNFINLGNLLKKCCDIATKLINLKKNDGLLPTKWQEDQKSIKSIKKLIKNNWSNRFTTLGTDHIENIVSNNPEDECSITSINFLPNIGENMSIKNNNNSVAASLKCTDLHQIYDSNSEFQKSKSENNIAVFLQNTKQSCSMSDNAADNNNLLPNAGVNNCTENNNNSDCIPASTEIQQTLQKSLQCKTNISYNRTPEKLECSRKPKINSSVWSDSENSDFVDDEGIGFEKNTPKKTVRNKSNYCLFCQKNVTNFARHLVRNHKNETEVAEYDALPKGSAERKIQVDLLRKRGNFLNHVQNGNKMKLVRRPKEFETKSISVSDYLPCKFCLGMFKKKLLHRHLKICKNNKSEGKNRAQADGQNLMLKLTDLDEELVNNVFPRMTGDDISFVAKSDKLITSFGVKYLKSHKDKNLITSVSQKMRILARFLIAMRSEVSSVHTLQDCLDPKYFDSIIEFTKKIGQYNKEMDIYESPTIVVKLGLLLKNCCDIALELILKKNDGHLLNTFVEDQESIKNIKYMIDVNWAYQFMSLNKKYIDVVDKSIKEPLAANTNVLPEIDFIDFISSESEQNNASVPMEYFGDQQDCKIDCASKKLNDEGNTKTFHILTEELCPIMYNCKLTDTDVDNRENKKNDASMTVSSLEKTQVSTKDLQHNFNTLHDNRDNGDENNECNNFSSDSVHEDCECLPCLENLSINNIEHHITDSNTSEKCENSQFLWNTSSTNVSKNNSPKPLESDNSNLDKEIQTRSKTVIRKKKLRDKSNYCLFCEKNVTNFTRHLVRKHKNEAEVTKYESLPKNSIERKLQADLLRKRGNFLCHVEKGKEIKVVRRSKEFETKSASVCDYLPCKYCFGMFRKKYLHRHLRVCKNIKNKTEGRNRAQADGQNMMLKLTNMDEKLVENIFPRMACDDISFVAKSDKLITNYASNYLKHHNEKHSIASVTQKMRILARFVIAMKDEIDTVHSLQDCLTPEHFDTIIKCSKKMAQFNEKTNSFGSLSTVLKLGQLLKNCCDVALSSSLKESADEILNLNEKNKESFKNIKYMIENHWLYKLSTTSNYEESNQDTYYSPTLRSLTSDIILLCNNLIYLEKESYYNLKSSPNNVLAYQNLQESILVQIVLLNRCISNEEIQHISLEIFNNSLSGSSQEKNMQDLTSVEQNLFKYFKCINVQSKGGEIVPIWLTPQLLKLVQYLLELRITTNFISHANPHLFPLMHSSKSSMKVSDVIFKFGKESRAEHLENVSSTRFKKYVTTITRLLYLTEEDIEHLTTFIGYNTDIYREPIRLTDNAFQVAKLSKFLLLKEKCGGHECLKKSLDDLNFSVDDFISDEDQSVNDEDKCTLDQTILTSDLSNEQKSLAEGNPLSLNKNVCKRQLKRRNLPKNKKNVPWFAEEKAIITNFFEMHIITGKAPRKQECNELSKLYPQINKPWKKIKDFVHNTINAQKRNNDKFCVL